MSILVVNCSHWIGYHVVDALLDAGYEVDGIPLHDESDDLLMFFGRNSLFSLATNNQRKQYDVSIIIGDYDEKDTLNTKRKVIINSKQQREKREEDNIAFHALCLFGEWMPMNAEGCYFNDEFILFKSDYFKENAIYVKDFTKGLLQWIELAILPQDNKGKSRNRINEQKLEDLIYFRDNVTKEKQLENVIKHYHSHKNFYK